MGEPRIWSSEEHPWLPPRPQKQPWHFRDQKYNGRFPIVTLEEFLDVALKAKRNVGVHLEVSWLAFFFFLFV